MLGTGLVIQTSAHHIVVNLGECLFFFFFFSFAG
uniref:Uncharacterized protein n=1 Tax=Sus scrofa TaxID=9823 RepID=Q5UER2_PIG|nr:unknown [Sus scrofa]